MSVVFTVSNPPSSHHPYEHPVPTEPQNFQFKKSMNKKGRTNPKKMNPENPWDVIFGVKLPPVLRPFSSGCQHHGGSFVFP